MRENPKQTTSRKSIRRRGHTVYWHPTDVTSRRRVASAALRTDLEVFALPVTQHAAKSEDPRSRQGSVSFRVKILC